MTVQPKPSVPLGGTAAVNRVDRRHPGEKGRSVATGNVNCYRCGGRHLARNCRFKEVDCYVCGKKGHIAKVCRNRSKKNTFSTRREKKTEAETHVVSEEGEEVFTVLRLNRDRTKPLYVTVMANKELIEMEIDTGAAVSG